MGWYVFKQQFLVFFKYMLVKNYVKISIICLKTENVCLNLRIKRGLIYQVFIDTLYRPEKKNIFDIQHTKERRIYLMD